MAKTSTTEVVFQSYEDKASFLKNHGNIYRTLRELYPWPHIISPEDIVAKGKEYSQQFRDRLFDVSGEKKEDVIKFVNENMPGLHELLQSSDVLKSELAAGTSSSNESASPENLHDTRLVSWLEFPAMVVKCGQLDLLKLCIKTGVDLNKFRCEEKGKTLLQIAVTMGDVNLEIVEELLNVTDLNIESGLGNTLTAAIDTGRTGETQWKLLNLFVYNGADLDSKTILKVSALHRYVASLQQDFDSKYWASTINLLLPKSGDGINIKNITGQTVLQECVQSVPPMIFEADEFSEEEKETMLKRESI